MDREGANIGVVGGSCRWELASLNILCLVATVKRGEMNREGVCWSHSWRWVERMTSIVLTSDVRAP